MSVTIVQPGPQATLQAAARRGYRHMGVPNSGPADPLSMALANRCVGNPCDATSIEFTYGPVAVRFEADMSFAFAGANAVATLNGEPVAPHAAQFAAAGSTLELAPFSTGLRVYLSIAGGFAADMMLGSQSTYLPAGLGGHGGRALKAGDQLAQRTSPAPSDNLCATPDNMKPALGSSFALRAVIGPDAGQEAGALFDEPFKLTNRADRMGVEIVGAIPQPAQSGAKPSAAIFPGALQVPEAGKGFLLLPDAQTTGGYPHLLQVIRADRHLLGQLRPGSRITFLRRSVDEAAQITRAKQAHIRTWLPDFSFT